MRITTMTLGVAAILFATTHSMPQFASQGRQSEFDNEISTSPRRLLPQGQKWKRYPDNYTECSGNYFYGAIGDDMTVAIAQATAFCANVTNNDRSNYFKVGAVEVYLCDYEEYSSCNEFDANVVQDSINMIQAKCGQNQGGWQSYADQFNGNDQSWVYGIDPAGQGEC